MVLGYSFHRYHILSSVKSRFTIILPLSNNLCTLIIPVSLCSHQPDLYIANQIGIASSSIKKVLPMPGIENVCLLLQEFRTNVRRVIGKGGQKQKLTHTAPNVPEMRMPAVSQPTQTTLESTESVATEQVSTQAVMSEPTVSQPTQTVLEYTQTVSTEQVPTETAMKRMSPAMQEFAEVVAWLKSDLANHTSAVLLFRAASSHLTSPI
ncbi:hypothetical protein DTO013E5_5759 [Penicillium roqueforti]|uniref:uncharacterized protein n=1 Tax=Penicillium roqueforti TaxID=5082 RepID=UPI00190E54AE|nr:uncharacterized protein LCP9604111_7899 [Penicillium roqueforti]KAF9242716.1 hypothetical protein LCP9604111_7899 [Penicillium roqueforti]KAI1830578.1 hypothetical protein CBS147337_8644 [Penicillium roqueforti]KAI2674338.1 hypothetical protein CBS147355_6952 [Penicillium roqueforti]KAI2684005.1 hypothetical protein LCP963914a_5835 [Penicillium roqueforti]KAI2696707.1 hypothetical protein CBS147372_8357 [Penicillium roqueforti]